MGALRFDFHSLPRLVGPALRTDCRCPLPLVVERGGPPESAEFPARRLLTRRATDAVAVRLREEE